MNSRVLGETTGICCEHSHRQLPLWTDSHRIGPIGFDVFLCPSHLPGFDISRVLMQQIAEIVRICEKKCHEHRLLQLRQRRKWQRIR